MKTILQVMDASLSAKFPWEPSGVCVKPVWPVH